MSVDTIPFHGARQAALTVPPPSFALLIALDLHPGARAAQLRGLLARLSALAADLTQGVAPEGVSEPELAELTASLTITVGLGSRVFVLTGHAPPPGVGALPAMRTDRLQARFSGGDVLLELASHDPVVNAQASRVLIKAAREHAHLSWVQTGFRHPRGFGAAARTERNLMGQLDGTVNAAPGSREYEAQVFGGTDGFESWAPDATTAVVRRIAIDMETWDDMPYGGREYTIGRYNRSGAPLGGHDEFDEPDFDQTAHGVQVIAPVAHVRRARHRDPRVRIVRRAFNYFDGADRFGIPSVGLVFESLQASIVDQFVPVQRSLDELDFLNEWVVAIGSGTFAIPPGATEGGFVGDFLFE